MSLRRHSLAVALCVAVLTTLSACGQFGGQPENPDWVIHSKVVFLTEDFASQRQALPLSQFRLSFPYIAGDLYGAPTTGDFFNPTLGADYGFQIDLNRAEKPLLASLEPTEFGQSYLRILPPQARVARLAPMALQADGIEQVGRTDWVDPDSKRPLLLLFLDRPASIKGQTLVNGRALRYDISIASAGYVWVARRTGADGDTYTVVPRPAQPLLAITPLASDRPKAASPTRTDTPAR